MDLKLIVIRSNYATIGTTVLEIYPLSKEQATADKHLSLGFAIENFEQTISLLQQNEVRFITPPVDSEFGLWPLLNTRREGRLNYISLSSMIECYAYNINYAL